MKKFNLKNRPQFHGNERIEFSNDHPTEWFEGFEKRQRQNLADDQKALKTHEKSDKKFLARWKAISNYIELEVLGVEPKIKEETKR
jgi:hypothetical protein